MLHARFQRSPDEGARVQAETRTHHLAARQSIKQGGPCARHDEAIGVGTFGKVGEEGVERLAVIAAPEQRAAILALGTLCQRQRGLHMGAHQMVERHLLALEVAKQRTKRSAQTAEQSVQGRTCQPGFGQRLFQAVQPRCRAWPAQDGKLQAAHELARVSVLLAQPRQGMLQQGEQGHRRQPVGRGCRNQAQEGAAAGQQQGRAGGIIDGDVPAAQFACHAPGKVPVARHQRHGAARARQFLAHAHGGDLGLDARIGAGRNLQPRCCVFVWRGHRRPVGGLCGGQQRVGEQAAARRAGFGQVGIIGQGPGGDAVALGLQAFQQCLQSELRMARLDCLPGARVHVVVEAGQHHRALRQPRDGGEQAGGCRDGAGRTGRDHRMGWGMLAPVLGQAVEQPAPALGGVEITQPLQGLGPVGNGGVEEGERGFPVLGEFGVLDQVAQAVEIGFVGRHLIKEGGQRIGKLGRLLVAHRTQAAAGGMDAASEQQAPPQRRNCRRQIGDRLGFGEARQRQIVFVDIAQGADRGQDQRLAAGLAQEGLAQAAHGASRRHQHQHGGERLGRAAVLRDQSGRQRIDQRDTCGNGENPTRHARPARQGPRQGSRACRR